MKYVKAITSVILMLTFSSLPALAEQNAGVQVSRYVSINPTIEDSKLGPLNHVVSFNAGQHVTITAAISALLSKIGYQLHSNASEFNYILNRPVPEIHREFELLRIHQIVHVLMGEPYKVVVDASVRQISFKLDPSYVIDTAAPETAQ